MSKIIWSMWLQGIENAPYIIKHCYHSWLDKNPDWKVIILTNENIPDYLGKEFKLHTQPGVNIVAASDIIRLNLLAKYGGVWADATCFCCQPLDQWLPNVEEGEGDFFAFSNPAKDKRIASWFLATRAEGVFISRLRDEANRYWSENNFNFYQSHILLRPLGKLFQNSFVLNKLSNHLKQNPEMTRHWFSPVVRRLFNVYPYFWLHYLSNLLIANDEPCRRSWVAMEKIPADLPHTLQHIGLERPLTAEIKTEMDNLNTPVHKLSWRVSPSEKSDRVIDYFLRTATNG